VANGAGHPVALIKARISYGNQRAWGWIARACSVLCRRAIPCFFILLDAIREYAAQGYGGTAPGRSKESLVAALPQVFLTQTLQLGPVLQAAFPLFGGIAFVGMLEAQGEAC